MTDHLSGIDLNGDMESWLNALPGYQAEALRAMLIGKNPKVGHANRCNRLNC